jgi:hypothetical protein
MTGSALWTLSTVATVIATIVLLVALGTNVLLHVLLPPGRETLAGRRATTARTLAVVAAATFVPFVALVITRLAILLSEHPGP